MPDLSAILAFYQAILRGNFSGALRGEARCLAQREHDDVIRRFLSPVERATLMFMPNTMRRARLRKGEVRFRNWEAANPDIVAVLKRKAVGQVI